MAKFDLEKYVKDGHFERVLERTAERVRAEAKAFNLPSAGLSKDGKRMLPRERPAQPKPRPERERTA
jgi:hypothetical protein